MPDIVFIDTPGVVALAIIALWLGYWVSKKLKFLDDYNIPHAVSGGLIVSTVVGLIHSISGVTIEFNLELRSTLLIAFFSTIGLSAHFREMVKGGKSLAIMLGLASIVLVLQNILGISVTQLFNIHPSYGLTSGSISFVGGHATALTWGEIFTSRFGFDGYNELGVSMATFGLILGGFVGGPVAKLLMKYHKVKTPGGEGLLENVAPKNSDRKEYLIDLRSMINSIMLLAICFGIGALTNQWFVENEITFPGFLTAMFAGIVIANILDTLKLKVDMRPINLIGDISLQLFLGMSMISVKFWLLANAIDQIILILILQTLLISLFCIFIIFKVLGKDYDAVCITSGFIGMGLGATPVGIANINALTEKYGPSPKAYLVIPLLGAFFIDIVNAVVIQFILSLPMFA